MSQAATAHERIEIARAKARAAGVVVVGAGQAGGRAVEALRKHGFEGDITLIGDEPELPYERPSLSKDMLINPAAEAITWVQKPEFYAANKITVREGVRVEAIDRDASQLVLEDGERLPYGVLILATGARVRKLDLPGAAEVPCFYLRTLEDSRALRVRLEAGQHIVVIGAGFIGLEAAAAAVKRGCSVTVIEMAPLPLGRVVPEQIGQFYRDLHVGHGVRLLCGTKLAGLKERGGQVVVVTADGEEIVADTLVAGIGVIPNAELAAGAGLRVERGIIADEYGMTDDPQIFAVGDVSRHTNPLLGRQVMLESWQNAQNQAIAVAKNLGGAGEPAPHAELPWFWSDQYDVNLQMFGLPEAEAAPVLRGTPGQKTWLLFQLKDGKLVSAMGINAARDLRAARDLMTLAAKVTPEELADETKPLTELVKREKQARAAAA